MEVPPINGTSNINATNPVRDYMPNRQNGLNNDALQNQFQNLISNISQNANQQETLQLLNTFKAEELSRFMALIESMHEKEPSKLLKMLNDFTKTLKDNLRLYSLETYIPPNIKHEANTAQYVQPLLSSQNTQTDFNKQKEKSPERQKKNGSPNAEPNNEPFPEPQIDEDNFVSAILLLFGKIKDFIKKTRNNKKQKKEEAQAMDELEASCNDLQILLNDLQTSKNMNLTHPDISGHILSLKA